MSGSLALLRGDARARRFLAAHAQSSLGTGAAYVGLVLLAYERFRSPWAITLILLADFLPATLLGPLAGAAADRWSRRACAVAADTLRAGCFAALTFVDSFAATLALALVAGAGTALFKPAALAALPGMVGRERLPAATSLFSAISDAGNTLGPALAAVALLVVSPSALMLANGLTFAVSAAVLARTDFGAAAPRGRRPAGRRASLLAEAREGVAATRRTPAVRTLLLGSAATVLCVGAVNVGELLLAKSSFHAGGAGYSALVTASGLGIVAGSLLAGGRCSPADMKRWYLAGLLSMGLSIAGAGAAPVFWLAVAAFLASGLANGAAMVSDSLLIQTTVDDSVLGRVLGVRNSLVAGAFTVSFVCGGTVASLLGPRALLIAAGAAVALVWAASSIALRGLFSECPAGCGRAPTATAAVAG